MSSLNKFFGGLKQAGVSGRGNYFPYANAKYRLNISRFFYKSDRKDVFVAELDVVETLAFSSSKSDVVPPAAGERRSWVVDMTKELNMVQRDVNGFVLATIGVNVNNKPEAERALDQIEGLVQFAISDANPFGGSPLDLETFEHKTKGKGNDFTVHNWIPSASSAGLDAWLAKLPRGQYVSPNLTAAKQGPPVSAPAQAAGAPVQMGGRWFLPQADGSLKPIG